MFLSRAFELWFIFRRSDHIISDKPRPIYINLYDHNDPTEESSFATTCTVVQVLRRRHPIMDRWIYMTLSVVRWLCCCIIYDIQICTYTVL